jgi:hypothetical protein
VGDDEAWSKARPLVTHDPIAGIDITLRAVHTAEEIHFLVEYPDATENREHKTLVWDAATGTYQTGPAREDTLVLKWSLEPFPVDLTLLSDDPYQADVWYWKAHRTDPVGFADDKIQVYSDGELPESARLISRSGRAFYLTRNGDEGQSAYRPLVYDAHGKDEMLKYENRQPSGSRADIRAKGRWSDGKWTIELTRRLDTGHPDDVQFDTSQRYQFGVSRFEIAGRKPESGTDEPKFGCGEITEPLWLHFD